MVDVKRVGVKRVDVKRVGVKSVDECKEGRWV